MKVRSDVLDDAIRITAELVKVNSELKQENHKLRTMLLWCWQYAGRIFFKRLLERSVPRVKYGFKRDERKAYNNLRSYIDNLELK